MAPSLRELSRRLAAVTEGVRLPTGGARKTHKAYADPRVFRPLRRRAEGPSPFRGNCGCAYGSCAEWGTERLAGRRKTVRAYADPPVFRPLRRRAEGPSPFRENCSFAFSAAGSGRPQTPCGARKTLRAYADPPVFRPLRRRAEGPSPFRENCSFAFSAAGSARPQFLIILNSGGSDCILKAEYGIVGPSKDGIGNTASCGESEFREKQSSDVGTFSQAFFVYGKKK